MASDGHKAATLSHAQNEWWLQDWEYVSLSCPSARERVRRQRVPPALLPSSLGKPEESSSSSGVPQPAPQLAIHNSSVRHGSVPGTQPMPLPAADQVLNAASGPLCFPTFSAELGVECKSHGDLVLLVCQHCNRPVELECKSLEECCNLLTEWGVNDRRGSCNLCGYPRRQHPRFHGLVKPEVSCAKAATGRMMHRPPTPSPQEQHQQPSKRHKTDCAENPRDPYQDLFLHSQDGYLVVRDSSLNFAPQLREGLVEIAGCTDSVIQAAGTERNAVNATFNFTPYRGDKIEEWQRTNPPDAVRVINIWQPHKIQYRSGIVDQPKSFLDVRRLGGQLFCTFVQLKASRVSRRKRRCNLACVVDGPRKVVTVAIGNTASKFDAVCVRTFTAGAARQEPGPQLAAFVSWQGPDSSAHQGPAPQGPPSSGSGSSGQSSSSGSNSSGQAQAPPFFLCWRSDDGASVAMSTEDDDVASVRSVCSVEEEKCDQCGHPILDGLFRAVDSECNSQHHRDCPVALYLHTKSDVTSFEHFKYWLQRTLEFASCNCRAHQACRDLVAGRKWSFLAADSPSHIVNSSSILALETTVLDHRVFGRPLSVLRMPLQRWWQWMTQGYYVEPPLLIVLETDGQVIGPLPLFLNFYAHQSCVRWRSRLQLLHQLVGYYPLEPAAGLIVVEPTDAKDGKIYPTVVPRVLLYASTFSMHCSFISTLVLDPSFALIANSSSPLHVINNFAEHRPPHDTVDWGSAGLADYVQHVVFFLPHQQLLQLSPAQRENLVLMDIRLSHQARPLQHVLQHPLWSLAVLNRRCILLALYDANKLLSHGFHESRNENASLLALLPSERSDANEARVGGSPGNAEQSRFADNGTSSSSSAALASAQAPINGKGAQCAADFPASYADAARFGDIYAESTVTKALAPSERCSLYMVGHTKLTSGSREDSDMELNFVDTDLSPQADNELMSPPALNKNANVNYVSKGSLWHFASRAVSTVKGAVSAAWGRVCGGVPEQQQVDAATRSSERTRGAPRRWIMSCGVVLFALAVALLGAVLAFGPQSVQSAGRPHSSRESLLPIKPRLFPATGPEPSETCSASWVSTNFTCSSYTGAARCTCQRGYYHDNKFCEKCPPVSPPLLILMGIAVVMALRAFATAAPYLKGLGSPRILVNFVATTLAFRYFSIPWPQFFVGFLEVMKFFKIDFMQPTCLLPTLTFTQNWFLLQLTPIAIILILVLLYIVESALRYASHEVNLQLVEASTEAREHHPADRPQPTSVPDKDATAHAKERSQDSAFVQLSHADPDFWDVSPVPVVRHIEHQLDGLNSINGRSGLHHGDPFHRLHNNQRPKSCRCPINQPCQCKETLIAELIAQYEARASKSTNILINALCMTIMLAHLPLFYASLEVFRCTWLIGERRVLSIYQEIDCGSEEHQLLRSWAIVFLIIWGICLPAVLLGILWWYKWNDRLKENDIKERFGYMFIKYNKSEWYWEFVILLRKSALVMVIVLNEEEEDKFEQVLAGLFVLIIALWLQRLKNPFGESLLNKLEMLSLYNNFYVLLCGMTFLVGQVPFGEERSLGVAVVVCITIFFVGVLLLKEAVNEVREALPMLFEFDFPISFFEDDWYSRLRQQQYVVTKSLDFNKKLPSHLWYNFKVYFRRGTEYLRHIDVHWTGGAHLDHVQRDIHAHC